MKTVVCWRIIATSTTARSTKQEAVVHIGIVHMIKALYYMSKIFRLAPFKLTKNRFTETVLLKKLRDTLLYKLWFLFMLLLIILGGAMDLSEVSKCILSNAMFVGAFTFPSCPP